MIPTHPQDLAFVGMAGRFSNLKRMDQLWDCLRTGGTAYGKAPADANGAMENPGYFDADFFGLDSEEAKILDPQQRVFLQCAWEALEDAGCAARSYELKVGVFAASNPASYLLHHLLGQEEPIDEDRIKALLLANDPGCLAARVSGLLNLRGPSLAVHTGGSSLAAVCVACQQLIERQCDLALAGGISMSWPPGKTQSHDCDGLSSQHSPHADGAGVIVLKRLPEALAEGDHIYAVIKGFALNHDGGTRPGLAAPGESGLAECVMQAHAMGRIDPASMGFLVTDGTDDPEGQKAEMAELARTFQARAQGGRSCALGLIKSALGDLGTAAGISGLISASLALRYRQIPPCLREKSNQTPAFDQRPFFTSSGSAEWENGQTPRRAGVLSRGRGGSNACVILEEPPPAASSGPGRAPHLLVLSARTASALESASANLFTYLKSHPELELADVAYSLSTGRRAFDVRRAVLCENRIEALESLRTLNPERVFTRAPEPASLVFMFSSTGSERVNMARDWYEHEPFFREQIDICSQILQPQLGLDLRSVLYPPAAAAASAAEQLKQPRLAEPAVFVLEYALAKLWMRWGARPQALVGHGLGEYAAACVAGVFSLGDGLALAAVRGRVLQSPSRSARFTAAISEAAASPFMLGQITLEAVNTPELCVFSGPEPALETLRQTFLERGIACGSLTPSCERQLSDSALIPFLACLGKISFRPPRIPYISSLSGTWVTPEQVRNPAYWSQQLRLTLRLSDGLKELSKEPGRVLLEIGPGQNLSTFARQHPQTSPGTLILASLGESSVSGTPLNSLGQLWLAGVDIDWKQYYAPEHRRRVPLPTYPFEPAHYRADFGAQTAPLARAFETAAVPVPQPAPELPPMEPPLAVPEPGAKVLARTAENGRSPIPDPLGTSIDSTTIALGAAPAEAATPENRPPSEDVRKLPLTEAQREIWYAAQLGDVASSAYNTSVVLRLHGPLELSRLHQALQWLVSRHDGLRVTIAPEGDTQLFHREMPLRLPLTDMSSVPAGARESQLQGFLKEAVEQPFDLTGGPLVRVRLARLAPEEQVMVFTVHHLICDGASLDTLLHELADHYSAEAPNEVDSKPTPMQFSQFVQQQNELAEGPERAEAEAFWLGQFSRPVPNLDLPTDRPRPRKRNFSGGTATMPLGRSLSQELKRMSSKQRCTLFTTLLAGCYLLLHRLSGQSEIVIGLPMAARSGEGSDLLVGHCVNFLPLRLDLDDQVTFTEHLTNVRHLLLSAHEHIGYTFGSLLQKLNLPRDPGRMPLVSVMLNLDWSAEPVRFRGLQTELLPNPYCRSKLDLSLSMAECEGDLELQCQYSAELFTPETIQRWFGHYQKLLAAIAAHPDEPIGKLQEPLPSPAAPRLESAPTALVPRAQGPAKPLEATLIGIWGEVLGCAAIGPDDNFFDLGGHSVLITQIISRVRKALGVELTLRHVFEAPTIAELAAIIESEPSLAQSPANSTPGPASGLQPAATV